MPESVSCFPWNPENCRGTALCPPRCPRFLTAGGTPVLVEPHKPAVDECIGDLSSPARTGPDDLLLSASVEGGVAGYVWLRPDGGGRRRVEVVVAAAYEEELAAELARQAVAYAIADGAGRIVVDDGVRAFETAGFDTTVTNDNDGPVLSLSDPAAQAVMTAPGDEPPSKEREQLHESGDEGAIPDLPVPAEGPDLSGLFAPRRVAVVGATEREGSIGRLLLENLEGYRGEVVPVTPRSESVFGREAPSSLAETDGVDLALIALPPESTLEVLETAGETGIENVVVVSAGFEETGTDGAQYAAQFRDIATAYDLNVVGPNSMGVLSTASGLNASFSPRHPAPGSVSLVSQSGAFVTAALAEMAARGIGIRHAVSVGNKTVLDAVAYLQYLDCDPGTEVIAAYLEDVDRGEEFVEVARSVTHSTPVAVLKPGRTEAGAAAAASHTGSLVGADEAVQAAFDRAGVVRANSAGELFDGAAALRSPVPEGNAVGIVTNAGGPGVLAADAVAARCRLADIEESTRETLAELLGPSAAVGNPTDVLGDADVERFEDAIDAMLADDTVDVGLVVTAPHPLIDYADLVAAVGRRAHIHQTPVVTCLMDGDPDVATRRALRQYSIANYPDPSRAAAAIEIMWKAAQLREQPVVEPPDVQVVEGSADRQSAVDPDAPGVEFERIQERLERAAREGCEQLGVESLSLVSACGVDVPRWEVADTPVEAARIAANLGETVVLKVVSPDIAHKVDVGGVRLGVSPTAVEQECERLFEDVRESAPDAEIRGVVVQETVETEDAVETVVGVTDTRFGPLVTFGLGGVLVEQIGDVAFELAPLDEATARKLVSGVESADVLSGVRGRDSVDVDSLVDALVRLSTLVYTVPEITTLEVNPLVVTADGVTAVDLHVELDESV